MSIISYYIIFAVLSAFYYLRVISFGIFIRNLYKYRGTSTRIAIFIACLTYVLLTL